MNIRTEALIDILANLTPTTGRQFFEDYSERLAKETNVNSCVTNRLLDIKNPTYFIDYLRNKSFMDKYKNLFKEIDEGCKSTSKDELVNNFYEFFQYFYEYYSKDYGHHLSQTFKLEQKGIDKITYGPQIHSQDIITMKQQKNGRTIKNIKVFSDGVIKNAFPYQITREGITESGCTLELERPTFVVYKSPNIIWAQNVLIAEDPDFDFESLPTKEEFSNNKFYFSDIVEEAINEGKKQIPQLQGQPVKQLYKEMK